MSSSTIDSHAVARPTPSLPDSMPSGRLLVLVPDNLDYITVTRRIWQLGVTMKMRIQLLGQCKDVALEPTLRRQLIMMAALIGDSRVATEAKIEIGTNWVTIVKRNYQPGDLIVCFAEQQAGLLHRPLNQILEAALDIPVYILSGLYTRENSRAGWVSQTLAWGGSIGILAVFFLLQSRIGLLPDDWSQRTLLILTVIFEFWLILVWNGLFE